MKISIIGCGNMGSAIARGLAKGTMVSVANITVANPSQGKLDALKNEISQINITNDNAAAIRNADIIIFAVKPWKMEEVVSELKPVINCKTQQIVSVAAGIELQQIAEWLSKGDGCVPTIYTIIPNTAISVGSSMTFIASLGASEVQKQTIKSIFDEMGKTIFVEESQMNACMILASCGIAYAMRYVRAASEGGVELGIGANEAKNIVLQTIKGAVDLLLATGNHPEAEIDKVTTPGGITIKGLNEMEHAGFSSSVIRGLKACLK